MAIELATAYVSILPETSKIAPGVTKALSGAEGGAAASGGRIGVGLLGGLTKAVGIAGGIGSVLFGGSVLKGGLDRLTTIQDATSSLTTIMGDATKAGNLLDEIKKTVQGTPFSLDEFATAGKNLVAMGVGAEKVPGYLTAIGEAAAASGKGAEGVSSITDAFGKMAATGKVSLDQVNTIAYAGVPGLQILANGFGVTTEEMSKMISKGAVPAAEAMDILSKGIVEGSDGAAGATASYAGTMAGLRQTLTGATGGLKSAGDRLGAAILAPFLPMATTGINKLTSFTDTLTAKVTPVAQNVANTMTEMGAAFASSGASVEGQGTKMERAAVKARQFTDGLQGIYSLLVNGDFKGASMTFGLEEDSAAVDNLLKIRDTAIGAYNILFKGDYTNPIWGGLEDSSAVDTLFKIREGAQNLIESFKGLFSDKSTDEFGDSLGTIGEAGSNAVTAMSNMEKAVGPLSDAVGKASDASTGLGTSLIGIAGDSTTVVASGVKALGDAMGFLADHTEIVAPLIYTLVGAMTAAKVIDEAYKVAIIARTIMMPAQMLVQRQLTQALILHTAALRNDIIAQGGSVAAERVGIIERARAAVSTRTQTIVSTARTAALNTETSALARFAAAQRIAATNAGALNSGVRNAAAGVATLGAGAAGVGNAGMNALRTGASKAASFIGPGGGFMIGIAAAVVLVSAFKSSSDKMNEGLDAIRDRAGNTAKAMREFRTDLDDAFNQSGGKADSGVKSVVSGQIEKVDAEIDAAADRLPGKWDKAVAFFQESFSFGQGNQIGDLMEVGDAGRDAQKAQSALDKLGLSQKDLTAGVTGSASAWAVFQQQLSSTGTGGQLLAQRYGEVRQEFIESQSSANQVKDALLDISTNSIGAAGGVDSLTSAMGRLRGDQMTAEEAQKSVNDALRGFTAASADGALAVVDAAGKIDTTSEAGSRLFDAMKGVQRAFDEAGAEAARSATEQKLSAGDAANFVEQAGIRVRDEFIRQRVEAGMTLEQATALANQYGLFPADLATNVRLVGADEALNKLTVIQGALANLAGTAPIQVSSPLVNVPRNSALPLPGAVTPRAEGGIDGPLPRNAEIRTPSQRLIQWAEPETGGEAFIPLGSNKRSRSTALLGRVADMFGYRIEKYADGGIQDALNAGRSVQNNKYQWGGTGPTNFDCSGFVGWLQQIVQGIIGSTKRLYTTYSLLSGQTAGLEPGMGPAGTLFQVGVSEEHMAATVAGNNAESGGANGTSGIGPERAGAADSQFPNKFHLPNELIAGGVDGGTYDGTSSLTSSYSSSSKKKATWSDKQELDLESARTSITQAEEARSKVEAAVAEGKKSQADLDQANIRVQKAKQRVTDLQKKKDDAAAGLDAGPAPMAPDLAKAYTDQEISRMEKQLALDDAIAKRNEVYDDPESTPDDKTRADIDLSRARNALNEKDDESGSGSSEPFTIKGRLKDLGSELVGIGIDALFEQMPFDLGSSRWWDMDLSAFNAKSTDDGKDSFSKGELADQLPVTPGAPGWLDGMLSLLQGDFKGGLGVEEDDPRVVGVLGARSLAVDGDFTGNLRDTFGVEEDNPVVDWFLRNREKVPVFDQGGILKPGYNLVNNLTGGNEALANVTGFLNELEPSMAATGGGGPDFSITIGEIRGHDTREVMKQINGIQARQMMRYGGRQS
jgi:tape measure domain-containing protein